ncbi:MAG: HNH endonuclease [Brevibacterium sp.]|nr:HNH endonuclease [Brevibacterium sp.]
MTLTPDRTPQNPEERDPRSVSRDADAAAGADPGAESSAPEPPSLFEQLKDSNLDLTGHPLAEKFESLAAVPAAEPEAVAEPAAETELETVCEPAAESDESIENGEPNARSGDAARDSTTSSPHPLLSNVEWTDLSRFAPEVTNSLTALSELRDGLRTFDRRMDPDEAIRLIDGLEALGRVNEALSTLALAVCERRGTPTDYGAKTTKALIQDRLNITGREANRRTEMAKNLGGRITLTGEAQPPLYPKVADAFNEGRLSSDQATVIKDCMKKLPTWTNEENRDYAETTLVEKAPSVRVYDLRAIFARILAHIDPDGKPPTDATDRSMYKISMHARESGDWEIAGLLDPITGGQLNGLLTARTKIAKDDDGAADVSGGESSAGPDGPTSNESGVRDDGTLVDMTGQKLTAQEWIYERFATLIGRIDMTRTGQGSQYALVVTAKAEDLAKGTGTGTTGNENPVPISELVRNGLNGALFFELISDKAKAMQVVTENRYANAKQIAILTARDQGCTFPGCDAPPGWCDAHHIVEWANEGRTDINNMMLSCSAHHHLLDRSDWETVMLKDGRPAWVPPASIDPARRPILHARFVAQEVIDDLFDG